MMTHLSELSRTIFKHLKNLVEVFSMTPHGQEAEKAMQIGKKWCGAGLKETMRLAKVLVEAIRPGADKATARTVYPSFVAKCKDFRADMLELRGIVRALPEDYVKVTFHLVYFLIHLRFTG